MNELDHSFDLDFDLLDFGFDDDDSFDLGYDSDEYLLQDTYTVGMGQVGVTRVENTVQTIETKLTEMDELERKILISIDNDMNKDKTQLGGNEVERAKSAQKIREEKELLEKLGLVRPRLHKKMREVIKVLPKREQYRLLRRMDLRHRFSLGTEMDAV
ncbi:Uncharacterized protein QTN25_000138 [Entamoeba marina]